MSEKLCTKCQAPLEDETQEICAACAASEDEVIEENEVVATEEVVNEVDDQAYIEYEVVEEEPVKNGSESIVLKVLTAVFAVLGSIYPVIYFVQSVKDFASQLAEAKEQYAAMNIPFELPAGLLPAQYTVFSVYLLIALVAIVGAALIFSKKTSAVAVCLLGFGASWGITTGIPNLVANLLMYQEGQEPITFAHPLALISLSGILVLAAAILAVIVVCKNYKASAELVFDEEVVIDPLAFDDGEAEIEEEIVEEEEEEVIEVNNEE